MKLKLTKSINKNSNYNDKSLTSNITYDTILNKQLSWKFQFIKIANMINMLISGFEYRESKYYWPQLNAEATLNS